MKNSKTEIPAGAREYFAAIGRRGGRAGSREDKRKAALARWAKPGARKAVEA